jgi:hypothetical protein
VANNPDVGLGAIRDKNLDYVLKRVFIPAQAAVNTQVSGASTVLTAGWDAVGSNFVQLGSATGVGAIRLNISTQNIDVFWQVPYDFDNRWRLLVRHLWSTEYTGTDGAATLRTLFQPYSIRTATAPTAPATALTLAVPSSIKTSATQRAPVWTSFGYIAPLATGGFANSTFAVDTEFLGLRVNVSASSNLLFSSNNVYWFGMELAYTPATCYGDGSRREGRGLILPLDHTMEASGSADF